jgi:NTP pyrophosphatase (non-canonical NTP hydrolase)
MKTLKKEISKFVKERNWDKYHSPKNLAMGLSIEASELSEIFLWLTEEESKKLNNNQLTNLKEEIGDIMVYLTNLADKFDLDPIQCAKEKIKQNKNKYPAKVVKGSAKKYTEYK